MVITLDLVIGIIIGIIISFMIFFTFMVRGVLYAVYDNDKLIRIECNVDTTINDKKFIILNIVKRNERRNNDNT